MAEIELKVYKGGSGRYEVDSTTAVDLRHLKIEYSSDVDIQVNDVIWFEEAMGRGDYSYIMKVVSVGENNSFTAIRTDEGFLKEILPIPRGTIFKLIASQREV
jgi:hypothetical protein